MDETARLFHSHRDDRGTAERTRVTTIYDKEIAPYIAGLMAAKIEAGMAISQDFTFTAHDLFSVTGANHSARSYSGLADALERLQGTQIRTSIEAGGEGEEGFFSWLSEARLQYARTANGEKRLKSVKVRLCDWLYRAILRDCQVLDYASTYFQLGPIERRIYEVARSSCADGEPLDIDLQLLKLQTGFQNPLSNFRIAMRQIAAANAIPDYDIRLIEDVAAASTSEGGPREAGRRPTTARVVITRRRALTIEATDVPG
jgi:plasmid replication initiation protein